jgi:BirA family biotin operon repressor/biotin-[acetyl-CoA-carboxylase] ligase
MVESPQRSHAAEAAVLKAFFDSSGKKLFLKDLESLTGLDRKTVKRAIEGLRESGIVIDGRGGFTLGKVPDLITAPLFLCGLKSKVLGHNVYSYRSVGSTNETARRLAESGAPEGTIVIADRQTKGRGRLGRSWHSPAGLGLFFSLVLRPRIPFDRAPGLSLLAALSICRVTEKMGDLEPRIKWPNDCLLDGKKMAGILVEISAELDKIGYAIVGVGININHRKKDFPSSLRSKATSLAMKNGDRHDRAAFLRDFIHQFEKDYGNFCRYGLRFMGRALVERSSVLGRNITVRFGRKKITGTAVGFDENGALRMKTGEGVRLVSAGEVTLR